MRYLCGLVGAVILALVLQTAAYGEAGDAACAEDGKIALFNGKDFSGWKLFIPDSQVDPKTVWSVRDGVIHCTGRPAGYMRTEKEYENYRLTFQWRWPNDGGNSGVLLHICGKDEVWPKSIEGQLQHEHAGDFWAIGGTDFEEHTSIASRRVPKMKPHNEKKPGQWNEYEVLCDGNTIKLTINGLLQNQATETTVAKGFIGLQSEGAPIEFRDIILEPLKKQP